MTVGVGLDNGHDRAVAMQAGLKSARDSGRARRDRWWRRLCVQRYLRLMKKSALFSHPVAGACRFSHRVPAADRGTKHLGASGRWVNKAFLSDYQIVTGARSDFQDFLFLLLDRIVDLLYVLIGQLLNFRFRFA